MKYILDVDASKVIEAVRSTGVTITPAMMHYAHVICSGLKSTGMWQNSVAIYGILGGTAASHKWNWKDLRDVDAAFRLSFIGGVTHNDLGIKSNGTTGYANTFLAPLTSLTLNNTHLSAYINDNQTSGGSWDMGVTNANASIALALRVRATGNRLSVDMYDEANGFIDNFNITNAIGTTIATRTASNSLKVFKNSNLINSITSTGGSLSAGTMYLLARNAQPVAGGFSTLRGAFYSIGLGLTDSQAIGSSQIITQAQSILNRAL